MLGAARPGDGATFATICDAKGDGACCKHEHFRDVANRSSAWGASKDQASAAASHRDWCGAARRSWCHKGISTQVHRHMRCRCCKTHAHHRCCNRSMLVLQRMWEVGIAGTAGDRRYRKEKLPVLQWSVAHKCWKGHRQRSVDDGRESTGRTVVRHAHRQGW